MNKKAREIPPVPVDEESLEGVIHIIKGGLHFYPQGCNSEETKGKLRRWVADREREIGGEHEMPPVNQDDQVPFTVDLNTAPQEEEKEPESVAVDPRLIGGGNS